MLIFCMLDESGFGLMALYACLIHELGHMIAMLLVKSKPDKILFYCAGIKIHNSMQYKLSFIKELLVLSFGSAINFLMFFLLYFNIHTETASVFAIIHLLIGIFNLLPVNMFDGGKIIELILSHFLLPDKAYYISKCIGTAFTLLLLFAAILMFSFDIVNFTFLLTICYICIATIIFPYFS